MLNISKKDDRSRLPSPPLQVLVDIVADVQKAERCGEQPILVRKVTEKAHTRGRELASLQAARWCSDGPACSLPIMVGVPPESGGNGVQVCGTSKLVGSGA